MVALRRFVTKGPYPIPAKMAPRPSSGGHLIDNLSP